MPSRLRFDSDVSEVMYDVDSAADESTEIRCQKLGLGKVEDVMSTRALFRVGTQIFMDPPRSMKITNEWQQIRSDSGKSGDESELVRGIVVAFRDMMLQAKELPECEHSLRPDEHQNYVYDILLHDPFTYGEMRTPNIGDKVTLRLGATMRFVGGVLKSRGSAELPTFPVGVVLDCESLQDTCLQACNSDEDKQKRATHVKIRLLDSEEFSWYNTDDLQVIEAWDRKLKEAVPEGWLRDIRGSFRSQIEHMCLQEVFQSCPTHRIPVFQRRYCWTRLQWIDLWRDLKRMRCADPDVPNHSLGRLLLRQRDDGSRLILDGQQRLTTISLLLSALHDRLVSLGEKHEVEALEGFRGGEHLIPTLDDRADFRRCFSEASPEGDGGLLEAKRLYSSFCEDLSVEDCVELVATLKQRFSFMVFILQSDQRLQVIYHMMSKGWGSEGTTAGIEMSPVDFIRNFVLEHFTDEQMMRKMHAEYWSPLETVVGSVENMEYYFQTFLASRGFQTQRDGLFDSFEAWWKFGIQSQQVDLAEYAATKLMEIRQALR